MKGYPEVEEWDHRADLGDICRFCIKSNITAILQCLKYYSQEGILLLTRHWSGRRES